MKKVVLAAALTCHAIAGRHSVGRRPELLFAGGHRSGAGAALSNKSHGHQLGLPGYRLRRISGPQHGRDLALSERDDRPLPTHGGARNPKSAFDAWQASLANRSCAQASYHSDRAILPAIDRDAEAGRHSRYQRISRLRRSPMRWTASIRGVRSSWSVSRSDDLQLERGAMPVGGRTDMALRHDPTIGQHGWLRKTTPRRVVPTSLIPYPTRKGR